MTKPYMLGKGDRHVPHIGIEIYAGLQPVKTRIMRPMSVPSTKFSAASRPDVWTVSRLNREAKAILEGAFPLIWVEGELSNFSRPRSGHWYFTLKDPVAHVRCAMFKGRNMALRMVPKDGMQVRMRARVSLYEGRGDFQLIAEHMEEAGDGALKRAFEETKARLAAAGLFDASRKKSIPSMPKAVGVMTSASGAAVHDVLRVLNNRFPALPVVLYPVPVQGDQAVPAMLRMLGIIAARSEVDVLLMVRGGGSLEDLAAFNDESLARLVADFPIPVVAGVGHEVDFSIVDFVADLRTATPSAAAEAVSPDGVALQRQLRLLNQRLQTRMGLIQQFAGKRLAQDLARLQRQHPEKALEGRAQRLDESELRLNRLVNALLERRRVRLAFALRRLAQQHPQRKTQLLRQRMGQLLARLKQSSPGFGIHQKQQQLQLMKQRQLRAHAVRIQAHEQRLGSLARQLDAVSPLAVLGRGFSIVTGADGKVIESSKAVEVGDTVDARLREGHLTCRVEAKQE